MTRVTATSTKKSSDSTSPKQHVSVLIIGSGFSGLGAAIKLSQQGETDFLVLERGSEVGGTWRDNSYPGAACDVPSHLYSYSFALNPNWSRSFSPQPEIQQYIRDTANKYGVNNKHIFGCEVTSAHWNSTTNLWEVATTKGNFTANIVVSAVGALCEPSLPDIKGIGDFTGEMFHSARWNHDADLTGKRVAVIGTGASAIQIVPQLAKSVAQLDVYQRTAPWILPRPDRPYSKLERFAFKKIPGFQRLSRSAIYWIRETQVIGLTKIPALLKPLQAAASSHLRKQVPDPELRAKLTPNWGIGCKRMLISNNYFPAISQKHVNLVTDGIKEVRSNGIVSNDGTVREIDALVIATGFHVTDSPTFEHIFGKDGRSLTETWGDAGMQAYKGTTIANFPNMFFLVGPNVGLGHTSMIHMIESQINYVLSALKTIKKFNLATVEVRKDTQDEYNRSLQKKLSTSVWMNGGCASWYLDSHGNNTTLWPGFTFNFRKITKNFDLAAYQSTDKYESTNVTALPTANQGVSAS
ncbi:MAG: flavin-containing monooxygenase [Mycobacteriaceae bacterium]